MFVYECLSRLPCGRLFSSTDQVEDLSLRSKHFACFKAIGEGSCLFMELHNIRLQGPVCMAGQVEQAGQGIASNKPRRKNWYGATWVFKKD